MPLILRLHICLLSAPNVPVAEQTAEPMAAEVPVKPSAQSVLLAPCDLNKTQSRAQRRNQAWL